MPRPIPFPTKGKPAPKETQETTAMPEETRLESEQLEASPKVTDTPTESDLIEETPDPTPEKENIPEQTPPKEEMPSDVNMENAVIIDGKPVEIKPTKLKYFRNKTTSSYGYLKAIPLHEFLAYDKATIGKDPDQMLYDFLVAAFDDSTFVRDHYDEMTADDVERVIKIFGRINHIDEKEEAARKNREAQAAKH